ncbi:MAG: hypothetical protein ABI813_13995 [Bacteroidota bacterium]
MKRFYTLILLLFVSAVSFGQYYTYTATKSGSWNDLSVWNISLRTDGIHKAKVVIPATYNILVDNGVNSFGLGDVEIKIMGKLSLLPSTSINLSAASTIELLGSGRVVGTSSSQKIVIGGITKYNGSLDFTKTGASIASSATGISPNGFALTSLLPVVFTSFTVVKNTSDIVLKWSTASEMQNSYFEVERSYNGNSWSPVSSIKANGTGTAGATYSYADITANASIVYYRLKQVDADGRSTYSTIKTIHSGNNSAAKIYGSGKAITIELNTAVKNAVVVTVMTLNGQILEKKQFSTGYRINLALKNSASGIMVVNVSDNDALNQTTKLFL